LKRVDTSVDEFVLLVLDVFNNEQNTMKSGNFIQYLIPLILITLIHTSCGSDRSKKPQRIDRDDISLTETFEIINRIKLVYHLYPSPAEMLAAIDMANLEFDGELPNSLEHVSKYLDSRSIILNLGVYITDMAYCALFGRHEETVDYLDILPNMAERIRIAGALNNAMIDRVKSNVEYPDSLFNISNEAFIRMLSFCEKNQCSNTMMLISAGAFIESLYLAVKTAGEYNMENYLIKHLADQKFTIDNLMADVEKNVDDPNVLSTMFELKPIKDIYDHLERYEVKTTLTKDNSNRLVIAGGTKFSLTEEDYNRLKTTTIEIRNKITQNEND
jgi:hypothetical protein